MEKRSTVEEGEEAGENDEEKTTGHNYGDRRGNEGVDWFEFICFGRGYSRHFEDPGVKRKYCDLFQRLLEEEEKGFVLRLRVERVISVGKRETRRKVRCVSQRFERVFGEKR